jgi:hypothetical protein
VRLSQGEHCRVAAVDELSEGLLLTGAQALEEVGLVLNTGLRHVATYRRRDV